MTQEEYSGHPVPEEHHPILFLGIRSSLDKLLVPFKQYVVKGRRALDGHHGLPPSHHFLVLGEKTVASYVHPVAIVIYRPGYTAHERALLKHQGLDVSLPEKLKGGGQSCGADVASGLPYRDFITVGVLVKKLKITNGTKINTYEGRVPDTWIYVQERDVKVGRLQIFNNWSPYMVSDYKGTMYVGMEYFCDEGDKLWEMPDNEFVDMALGELEKIGVADRSDVLKADRIKVKKAYPAYFGTYKEISKVREWLDGFQNLFCIGRNGQHRYNNMDHSMLTAMEAVRCIKENISSKDNVWEVNTEKEYHETVKA